MKNKNVVISLVVGGVAIGAFTYWMWKRKQAKQNQLPVRATNIPKAQQAPPPAIAPPPTSPLPSGEDYNLPDPEKLPKSGYEFVERDFRIVE